MPTLPVNVGFRGQRWDLDNRSCCYQPGGAASYREIIDIIVQDERLRRTSAQMKAAMKEQPMDPTRFAVPMEEVALRKYLLGMDPFHFERHTMSFFDAAGFEAWATRKSNDFGVDGFAVHPDGLMITQCKRNSTDNKVGRPTIQQFKGVVTVEFSTKRTSRDLRSR